MKTHFFHSSFFLRSIHWRSVLTELSVIIFILLFGYAAFSKLITFRMFSEQLAQVPLIGDYSELMAWLIPVIELFVCMLLIFPINRLPGLRAFIIIMLGFTVYIALMLAFSSHVPCICGGVISGLGWAEHLVFNTAFLFWGCVLLYGFKRELRA